MLKNESKDFVSIQMLLEDLRHLTFSISAGFGPEPRAQGPWSLQPKSKILGTLRFPYPQK